MTNQITYTASNGSQVVVTATDVLTMTVDGVLATVSDKAHVVTDKNLIDKGVYANFGGKFIGKELYNLILTLNTIKTPVVIDAYDAKYAEIEKAMNY